VGLDSFAVVRGEDGEWHVAPDGPFDGLRLCECEGSASFRGKVYDEVVLAATGASLYQGRIDPATVAGMARAFREAVEEAKRAGQRVAERPAGVDERGEPRVTTFPVLDVAGCRIHAHEAEDLARWLEVCAEHGYAVDGWW
jgi:hypothetical protein